MASKDVFICPYDASETLLADIAAQVAIGHPIEKDREHRRPHKGGFYCPDDATDTLMADIAAQIDMPPEENKVVEEHKAKGGFYCPDDATDTLIADIAAQVNMRPQENKVVEEHKAKGGFVCSDDATETLMADIAAQVNMPRAHEEERRRRRERRWSDEDIDNEAIERSLNVIRSSNQVGDYQNREFVSATEHLVTTFKEGDVETLAAQQVIASIMESNVDNALASILYSQLEEGLRYYKTSKNFGGNLNNVIRSILEFFDVFTQKSLEISRHTIDTCLVDAVKFILTKFKVHHFQNTLNEKIQKFLYLALKLSCQLLMHEDETIIIWIKEKRLIDIVRLYVSSPDPQFQLLALMATGFLGDVGNSDRFFINPLAMKVLMESVRDNDSQIPIETMVQALEKLMQFEDNVEMLMEFGFVSSLRTMLETDDVAVVLAGLRLLSCLSNDDSIAPLVRDQLIHVLRSRCLSFPQPAVKTAASRLIKLLNEKIGIGRTNILSHTGGDGTPEEIRTRDIINTGRHIMVSYSHRDKPKAERISEFLQRHNYEVWIDRENPKNNLHDMMASAVENASLFIYCISESYKRSENTKKEFMHAAELGKTMIPIRLDECHPDGWLERHNADAFMHDMREISDAALYRLLQDISNIRNDARGGDGDMLTLRLGN